MNALDFYFRVGMGQLSEIKHVATAKSGHKPKNDSVEAIIAILKKELLGWDVCGTNHSIMSRDLPDYYRVACDIHDVLRQQLAIDDLNPVEKQFGVAFDEVIKKGSEPLPKIGRI